MKLLNFNYTFLVLFLLFAPVFSEGQEVLDPLRFKDDMARISKLEFKSVNNKKKVLFTGSSSITRWTDVQDYFPEVTTINTGFGGSVMNDLLFFADDAIIRFKPDIVFIYEGDNDIAAGFSIHTVLKNTRLLVNKLNEKLPGVKIVIISVKPSPERWHLNKDYHRLNDSFKKFCHAHHLEFANIWDIMLDKTGNPNPDIFISDKLHINKKGYQLWQSVLKEYMN